MSTAEQKKAAREAAKRVKDAGGDQAAQDAAAAAAGTEAARPQISTGPSDPVTGSAGDRSEPTGDPADDGDEERDVDGFTAAEREELRLAEQADLARAAAARKPAVPGLRRPILPETKGLNSPAAISLLLDACERFGVNPYADQKPKEVLGWAYYPGADDAAQVSPDSVVIVTGGGVKVRHWDDPDWPMDQDTKETLERVFGLSYTDPKTKQVLTRTLPDSLALPAVAVTGLGTSTDHQYVGGYVKAGGRVAAADKQKRRDERAKRHGLG